MYDYSVLRDFIVMNVKACLGLNERNKAWWEFIIHYYYFFADIWDKATHQILLESDRAASAGRWVTSGVMYAR